jgi:hypothetical protein
MARELGVGEDQVRRGAAELLPAIMGGFQKQAPAGGDDALGGLLGRLGGAGLLDNVLAPQPTDIGMGNNVLGEIFGSKDVSRSVAQNAASRSGLESSLLKRMLPMLAMMAAGYMAKQRSGAGAQAGSGGGFGDLGGLLASRMGGAGNPLDDVLRMTRR